MNIAQALAIAAASYVCALCTEAPLSAHVASAHARACTMVAEAEQLSKEALEDSRALVLAALQQNAGLTL